MAIRHNIIVSPDYPEARSVIERITTEGQPADATIIYDGPRNKLFLINEPELVDGDTPVNVKAFRVPPFPNNYVYSTMRAGKAARSYNFARRLTALGFLTPTPFGYSEILEGLRLTRSYYFCRHLPYPDLRYWEERPDRDAIIEALGAEMARLHAAGVWMKDFSTGNILVQPPAPETGMEGYRFHYVDLNRTAFGVKDRQRLMQMFKALSCSREITLEIAEAYARAANRKPSDVLAEAAHAFDSFHKRAQRKQRLKSLLHKRK